MKVPLLDLLPQYASIREPIMVDGRHINHQFVIRAERRDERRKRLSARGIGNEVCYPVPFHRQECFRHLGQPLDRFPNADAAAADVLALPIYPEVMQAQQEYVVSSIAELDA